MSYENVPPKDKAYAHLFSIASRSLTLVPPLNRLIVGRAIFPDGWRVCHVDALDFDTWLAFHGVKEKSSRLSRRFGQMGLMSVAQADVQLIRESGPGYRDGIARALGGAVVVGVLAEDSGFTAVEGHPGRLFTAAGLEPDRTPDDVEPRSQNFMPVLYDPSIDSIRVPGIPCSGGRVTAKELPPELAVRLT